MWLCVIPVGPKLAEVTAGIVVCVIGTSCRGTLNVVFLYFIYVQQLPHGIFSVYLFTTIRYIELINIISWFHIWRVFLAFMIDLRCFEFDQITFVILWTVTSWIVWAIKLIMSLTVKTAGRSTRWLQTPTIVYDASEQPRPPKRRWRLLLWQRHGLSRSGCCVRDFITLVTIHSPFQATISQTHKCHNVCNMVLEHLYKWLLPL